MLKQDLDAYFSQYVESKKKKSIQSSKDEYIAFEESNTTSISVVSQGVFKLSTFLKDGKEFNIKFVTAGEIVTLLENETSSVVQMPFALCTLSKTGEIQLLNRLSFWKDVKSDNILNEYVRLYYRKNLNSQIKKTCALTSHGKLGAVCNLLYDLYQLFGKNLMGGHLIDFEISNEELGKFCGIHNASSFNRILRQLKEANILEVVSNKILIYDLEKLQTTGGSSHLIN